MFIAVCYGTRPEYLKLLPFIKVLTSKSISHKVYHILQHIELNEVPEFEEVIVAVRTDISNRLNAISASILENLDHVFDKSHTHCVVQGDTSTALFCALYAFHNKIQVVHIEAGLRTYNLNAPWPEEANRQMISRIAAFHFTPHDECTKLLDKEHVSGLKFTVGNTILDLIKSYNLTLTQENLVLITFHRRENWDKLDLFIEQLKKILKSDPTIQFFWCMHPNPELQNKIISSFESYDNLTLSPPLNHKDFTQIMAKAKYLITDSGGLQEEASFLGKQCLVLREMTERYHIPFPYIHLIKDIRTLAEYVSRLTIGTLEPCNVYGDGTASEKILDQLLIDHVKDFIIIVQGPSTYVDHIRQSLHGYNVLFSTWIGDEYHYNNTDLVLINDYPVVNDGCIKNHVYQTTSTLNGLKRAKELGFKKAIKIRSDMIINNPYNFIKLFKKGINFLYSHTGHGGYLVDYCMGGNIDYIIDLWSFDINRQYAFPEVSTTEQFMKMNLRSDEVSFIGNKLHEYNDIYWIKYNIQISCYNNYPYYTTLFKDYGI